MTQHVAIHGTSNSQSTLAVITSRHTAIANLCRRAHALRLDLFGSATRADFDLERSDLDFVVVFEDMPPVEYSDAYFTLKEGLEALFARPVDLVVERAVRNPHFKSRLQAERRPVYAA
jgi:uncharacterized protein